MLSIEKLSRAHTPRPINFNVNSVFQNEYTSAAYADKLNPFSIETDIVAQNEKAGLSLLIGYRRNEILFPGWEEHYLDLEKQIPYAGTRHHLFEIHTTSYVVDSVRKYNTELSIVYSCKGKIVRVTYNSKGVISLLEPASIPFDAVSEDIPELSYCASEADIPRTINLTKTIHSYINEVNEVRPKLPLPNLII